MQLSDFINQALKFIERGTVDRKSKFRLPILASYHENTINQRIVIARKFDGNDNSLIIVRPTVIFGPGNRGNVYNLLKQIASGKFLMVGKGNNK